MIIMTGHGDVTLAVQAMKAGAVDFIEKPFEKAVLLSAHRGGLRAARSDPSCDRDRAEDAAVRLQGADAARARGAGRAGAGLPNKTIAYDLGISPRTVEIHRANLMTKLGVRSLSEALRIAFAAQGVL